MNTIEQLEETLANLKSAKLAAEMAQTKAAMEACPIVWKFTIEPEVKAWDKVYDDSCVIYNLKGFVENEEAALMAGHSSVKMESGSMNYLFNTLSGKLVMRLGGGRIWIHSDEWSRNGEHEKSAHWALTAISNFLIHNPAGGDITDIILLHQRECGL